MPRSLFAALLWLTLARSASCQTSLDDRIAHDSSDGQRALAAGDYRAAESDFLNLARLEPAVAEVHASLGLIYFQQKAYDRAVVELQKAKNLKPALGRVDSLLAVSLSELGDYEAALPGLETAFAQSKEAAVKRMCGLQLLRAYTGLKRDDKAVEVALALDRLYPSDAEVLYNTSKIYGNYAFLAVQKLAREAPQSIWRHLASAESYESQGSAIEAIGEYRVVLELDPRHIGIHYRIGRTLLAESHLTGDKSKVEQARAEFERELEIDPRNGNAAYEIAEIDRQQGHLDSASKFFQRALQEYPGFEEAHVGLAAVYLAQGNAGLAAEELKAAIKIDADDEVSWYRLSRAEQALGDREEQQDALAHFQRLHQAALARQSTKIQTPPSDVTSQQLDPAEIQ